MAITLRSKREIELMRKAGAVVANVLLKLKEISEPGVTTAHLDSVAMQMTADAGAEALLAISSITLKASFGSFLNL